MKKSIFNIFFILSLVFSMPNDVRAGYLLNEDESEKDEITKYLPGEVGKYKEYLPRVTKINAIAINQSEVLVSWERLGMTGVTYTVYRSEQPMITRQKVASSFRVGSVLDSYQFVDRSIYKPGIYYYAVTSKTINTREDTNLIPDRSYTTKGVSVNSVIVKIVVGIRSQATIQGIDLSWQCPDFNAGYFEIYRNTVPIENSQVLKGSKLIRTAKFSENFALDPEAIAGKKYYYAVMIRNATGSLNEIYISDQNYTIEGIEPTADLRPVQMNLVGTGGGIKLNWSFAGNNGLQNYIIVRTNKKPMSLADVSNGLQLNEVNITSGSYLRKNTGTSYYYSLVPFNFTNYSDYRLVEGINVASRSGSKGVAYSSKEGLNDNGEDYSGSDLQKVIRQKFNMGLYYEAEKALLYMEKNTGDSRELARIRLYLGRVKIETGRYDEALNYLSRKEVIKYFSADAKFWQDYCLMKMR